MADDNQDEDQKPPQIVINAAQPPAPNYAGVYNAAAQPTTDAPPQQVIPQQQSANNAAPSDLDALKGKLAGQQQLIPDKNINLNVNGGQGKISPAGYTQPQQPMANPYMQELDKNGQAQANAFRQEGAASLAAANLMNQQGAEEKLAYDTSNQKAQDLTADFQKQYQSHSDELNNALKDLNNGHVNPNQFYENQSVPQKIGTAISMLLGGVSAGLLHTENPVTKWLDSQVERDINAQKENINSAYAHYNRQMGDARQAENMSRALLQQNMANQIRATAAKYAGPIAQQNANALAANYEGKAQTLLGGIAMQKAQMNQQMAAQQMADSGMLEPEQQAIMLRDSKKMSEADFSKAMTEIGQARNAMQNHKAIMDAWDRGRGQFKMAGLRDAPGNAEFENLITPVMRENDGKINTTELDNMKKLESGAWKLPGTEASNRAVVEQYINAKKATPFSSGFGIKFPKQPTFTKYGKE